MSSFVDNPAVNSKDVDEFECLMVDNIITPINVDVLEQLLADTNLQDDKISKLVNGFQHGFDPGYRGPMERKNKASNLPFKPGVGDRLDMRNKIMKEGKLGRYVGPFLEEKLPFDFFMQSPIGLVPKAGGKTRLIFHLSYNFDPAEHE